MDRLLSEQAVIEEVYEYFRHLDINEVGNVTAMSSQIMRRIQALPAAEPQKELVATVHFDGDKLREIVEKTVEQLSLK